MGLDLANRDFALAARRSWDTKASTRDAAAYAQQAEAYNGVRTRNLELKEETWTRLACTRVT